MDDFNRGLIVGVDPGRRSSGLVIITTYPALGVAIAKRLPNAEVCDWLWKSSIQQVCVEDYRLYPWLAGSMKWDQLKEIRMIGAVEEICRRRQVSLVKVPPHQSKALVKDEDLVKLGTWSRNVHINDAFRVFWSVVLGGLNGEE